MLAAIMLEILKKLKFKNEIERSSPSKDFSLLPLYLVVFYLMYLDQTELTLHQRLQILRKEYKVMMDLSEPTNENKSKTINLKQVFQRFISNCLLPKEESLVQELS